MTDIELKRLLLQHNNFKVGASVIFIDSKSNKFNGTIVKIDLNDYSRGYVIFVKFDSYIQYYDPYDNGTIKSKELWFDLTGMYPNCNNTHGHLSKYSTGFIFVEEIHE